MPEDYDLHSSSTDEPTRSKGGLRDFSLGGDGKDDASSTATAAPSSAAAVDFRELEPRRRKKMLWPLLLLLLVVAFVGGYFAAQPRGGSFDLPARLDFGTVEVGSEQPETLTLINSANGRMKEIVAALADSAPGTVRILQDGCANARLRVGESCQLELMFSPAEAGVLSTALELVSTAGAATVELAGRGAVIEFAVDRPTVRYSRTRIGERSSVQTLIVANRGDSAEIVEQVSLVGDREEFVIKTDRCSGQELAPGTNCRLEIDFFPTAEGERSADLSLQVGRADTGRLSRLVGVSVASTSIRFPGGAPDFGEVTVADGGLSRSVRLENLKVEAVELTAVQLEGGEGVFTLDPAGCSGAILAPGASCEVMVNFSPRDDRPVAAALVVTASIGEPARLSLQAQGQVARFATRPSNLTFGSVRVGARERATVSVVNEGSAVGAVQVVTLAGSGVDVAEDSCSGRELAAGGSCSVAVRWQPSTPGGLTARLAIDVEGAQGAIEVPVTGTAVVGRLASSGSVNFGDVAWSQTVEREVVLTNSGNGSLRLERVRWTGAPGFRADPSSCRRLEPSASCRLTARFVADQEGEASGRIVVDHDGADSPTEIALSARALPRPLPAIGFSPSSLEFERVRTGERSAIATLLIRNSGSARLELSAPSVRGADSSAFRLVPGSCEGAPFIAAGSECTVGVRFTAEREGAATAELVIEHNARGGRSSVRLNGTGVAVPPS